jgi:integrase
MLAVLIGCGLRRGELLALKLASIQQREEHWVIADLVGKGGHVRTVPIPAWVKATIDAWTTAAGITEGTVFRAINKTGRVWGDGMTAKVLWDVGRAAAAKTGIEKLAPHDLRRHAGAGITGGHAHGFAISPVASWTRFSSSSGTCPFRRPSATSGASRNSAAL